MTTWHRRFFAVPTLVLSVLCVLGAIAMPQITHAGFGITPPYVKNERLTRNMVYEQKVTLVRSDPDEDLQAEITLNVPGAENWFLIDKGKKFILPKGETQVPVVFSVRVPENAEYKDYKGSIRIRTTSIDSKAKSSGVSIALGAQIDVLLKVVERIYDFEVRRIRVADLEEGRRKWGLFFPGKIRFFMTIENTGNTEFAPTKVQFDIYDANMEKLLETTQNTNEVTKVSPFTIREVVAELPTRLSAGRYVAKYTIYKNDEIAQQNQVTLSIAAAGSVMGYTGYGFEGLSTRDKMKAIGMFGTPLVLLLILIVILIAKRSHRRKTRQYGTTAR